MKGEREDDDGLGLIIGIKGKKKPEMKAEEESGEIDMEAAKLDAVKALRAALEAGDDQAVSDALEDHRAACEGY